MGVLTLKKTAYARAQRPLTIVIGKAVAKRAVDRNKIKRWVRTSIAAYLKQKVWAYAVIVRPGAAELPYTELRRLLREQLERVEY